MQRIISLIGIAVLIASATIATTIPSQGVANKTELTTQESFKNSSSTLSQRVRVAEVSEKCKAQFKSCKSKCIKGSNTNCKSQCKQQQSKCQSGG
jgi:hypothetical protein